MAIPTVFLVPHQCGHEESHDLSTKPVDERIGFAKWLAGRPCTACMPKAAKRSFVAARREWARKLGLPTLAGTEKMISVGARSRQEAIEAAREFFVAGGRLTEDQFTDTVITPARQVRSAHWWIAEAEGSEGKDLVDDLTRAPGAWEVTLGLPALTGKEKAVAYGSEVRHVLLTRARAALAAEDFQTRVVTPARQVRSAHWWIDRKDTTPETLPAAIAHAPEAIVAGMNLPTLEGSEKAVPWATDVRARLLADLVDLRSPAELDTLVGQARRIGQARWWLNVKDVPADDLDEVLAAGATNPAAAPCENPW